MRRKVSKRAVGLKKDSSAAHAALVHCWPTSATRQQALKHLSTALKLKPSAPVHFLMSAVYYGPGQHKRAIQHLKQATELDPQFGEAYYQLGTAVPGNELAPQSPGMFQNGASSQSSRERATANGVRSFSRERLALINSTRLIREELRLVQSKRQSGQRKR